MRQNAIEMIDVSHMKLTQQDCRPKQQVVNRNNNQGVSKTVLGIRTSSLPPPQPKPQYIKRQQIIEILNKFNHNSKSHIH